MTDQDKPVFLQSFNRLVIALRDKEPDTATLRVYFDALRDCDIEFIVAAAERLMNAEWFPKTSEWKGAARAIEHERMDQQRAVLRKLPTPLCRACDDTGWAMGGDNRASRCDCQEMRRLEVLGRRPMPQLLPSAPEPDPAQVARVDALVAQAVRGLR